MRLASRCRSIGRIPRWSRRPLAEFLPYRKCHVSLPATGTIGTPSTVTIRGTDSAPSFGTASVAARTCTAGAPIPDFQVPAATGGNGTISYAASNLPAARGPSPARSAAPPPRWAPPGR